VRPTLRALYSADTSSYAPHTGSHASVAESRSVPVTATGPASPPALAPNADWFRKSNPSVDGPTYVVPLRATS